MQVTHTKQLRRKSNCKPKNFENPETESSRDRGGLAVQKRGSGRTWQSIPRGPKRTESNSTEGRESKSKKKIYQQLQHERRGEIPKTVKKRSRKTWGKNEIKTKKKANSGSKGWRGSTPKTRKRRQNQKIPTTQERHWKPEKEKKNSEKTGQRDQGLA